MMTKLHYKMYKSGKQWCYAALATVVAVAGLAFANGTAFADTNDNQSTPVATVQAPQSAGEQSSTGNTTREEPATVNASTTDTKTITENNSTNNGTTTVTENTKSDSQSVTPKVPVEPTNNSQSENTSQSDNQSDQELNGVHQDNGNYYYYKDGVKQTNFYYTDPQTHLTYYFGDNGARWNDQFMKAWGNTYYFGNDGARWDNRFMVKWGNGYYFLGDGALMRNQTRDINGVRYVANNDGILSLHNQFLTANDNQLFYFDGNGQAIANKFYHNWGHTYYFGNDGARYTNQFLNLNGKIYYFDDQGIMYQDQYYKNWGHTYYFGANGARYTDQFLTKNGKVYYFDGQGIMYQNQWYRNWGNSYYFGADGARVTSEVAKVGNDYYYFDGQGIMKKDYFLNQDGHTYYFGNDGKEYRDRFYINWGNTYYFGPDGARWDNKWMTAWGHHYYFKADGARATNETLTINGVSVTFDKDGIATSGYDDFDAIRSQVADQIAKQLKQQRNANVLYDWTSQEHNYQELAAHDMAQMLAQGDVNNDPDVISSLMKKNNLLDGKVVSTMITNLGNQSVTIDSIADTFVNGISKSTDVNNTVLGVGFNSTDNKVAVLLFKPEQVTAPTKADSTIQANISAVYKASGTNATVKNPLTVNTTLNSSAFTGGLGQFNNGLLSGKQGSTISEDVLKTIFAGLGGNTTALEGTQTYYADNGDAYHYEFWLAGNNADDKLNNFLNLNKGAKYGDQLKVNYTATLTWGAPKEAVADHTPASDKTKDQINLAYQTGSETGLRYDRVNVEKLPGMTDDMIRGVDVSSYQALLNAGVKFYDFNGQEASLFKVLKDAGVNWIRLRIWNDPYNAAGNTYSGGENNEENLVKMAKEASDNGLKLLIDFQYSDFWTDPAQQILPKAWKGLSTADMTQEIYLYTSKILTDLHNAGASVSMVQIGNEITNGAFGLYTGRNGGGDWSSLWETKDGDQVAKYIQAGSSAVRRIDPKIKIAVQLETPEVNKYRGIMNVLKKNNVDYDYLGTSYYPFWSTKQGNGWYDHVDLGYGANTPVNLQAVEKMAWNEFGKKTVVLESGWLNNTNDADGTHNSVGENNSTTNIDSYSADPQGQVDEIRDMYKAVIAQNGVGAFYWEPAWIPVKAGWDNWQYNKLISGIYGSGWASQYAKGYAPDSVLYYDGKEAWGGSSWDNISLFDDHGHPLQSLNVYKGLLEGYKSPEAETSSLNAVISKIWNNTDVTPNDGMTEGSTVDSAQFVNDQVKGLLQGQVGQLIGNTTLSQIAEQLSNGVSSPIYTAANGAKYHYVYWLAGDANRVSDFVKANEKVKYGQPLTAQYSATVVVDAEPNVATATSPVKVQISEVWNTVAGKDIDISNPLTVGSTLNGNDADLSKVDSTAVKDKLTGPKGNEIPVATLNTVKGLLPEKLEGTKDYKTADGNHYHYEFWIKSIDGNAKYGDPVTVNYSASLKWSKKDA